MDTNKNMGIKRILDIVKNNIMLILVILVFFAVFGYIYSYAYTVPKYKSTETLLLIPNSESKNQTITNSDLTLNSGLISTYSNIAKNPKVLKNVINNLQLQMTEEELLSKVEVSTIKNTYIIEIAIADIHPERAKVIAEELSNVFMKEIKGIYNLDNIGIVDEANLPELPYNINHKKDISIFIVIGLLISALIIILIYIFDNKIISEEEVERYLQVKSLGSIPIDSNSKHDIIDKGDIKSYVAECINTVRTNILYMNASKNAKTILITSCTPGEGKSWVSANIATSFSDVNKKVLLIDTDLRKGRANEIFHVTNVNGLSEYLDSMTGNAKDDLELAKKYIKQTHIPNLHILTNGSIPQNPSELLVSNNMKELMELLKNAYDIIIIDAPPSKIVTDGIILSTISDSTVLVINSNKTSINDLKEVKKSIELVGGDIIGTILNKVKIPGSEYKKKYYYGNASKKDIPFKEAISVNKVVNEAIIRLQQKGWNLSYERNNNPNQEIKENNSINELILKQNQYLEEVAQNYHKISGQIENMQIGITDTIQEVKNNNTNVLNTVSDRVELVLDSNRRTLKGVAERIETKVQDVLDNNNSNIMNTKQEIQTKVQEIINNNNSTLEELQSNVNINVQKVLDSNSIALDVMQEKVTTKVQEILDNNNSTLNNIQGKVETKIEEVIESNNNTLNKVQENVEAKVQKVLESNNSTLNNIQENVEAKVQKVLESNNSTLNNIQEKVETKAQEVLESNNNTLNKVQEKVETKVQEVLESNNNTLNKVQENVEAKLQEVLVSNNDVIKDIDNKVIELINNNNELSSKLSDEIKNNNNQTVNIIKENINKEIANSTNAINQNIINTNNSIGKSAKDIINSNNNLTKNIKMEINDSKKDVNKLITDMNIEEKISLILNEKFVEIQKQIQNINYGDKLNEINRTVADLKQNYAKLYKMVNKSNNIESKDIVDISLWRKYKKFRVKKTYHINKEDISYYELERSAMCEFPLNVRNIENFKPKVYEGIM